MKLFNRTILWLYEHPFAGISTALFAAAVCLLSLKSLEFDTSTEGFLKPSNPVIRDFNLLKETFGRDDPLIIGISAPDILAPESLDRLRLLHNRLETFPGIKRVTSLADVKSFRTVNGNLVFETLLDSLDTPQQCRRKIRAAKGDGFLKNLMLAADPSFSFIICELDRAAPGETEMARESRENNLVDAIRTLLESFRAPGFHTHLAGIPVMKETLKRYMEADLPKFMGISGVIILLFLLMFLGRFSGVVLCNLIIIQTLMAVFASMAFARVSLKLPTQIIPSFLMTVCLADGVHILSIYYLFLRKNLGKKSALLRAYHHTLVPVLMTSLTTAAGMLSFAGSEVAPISELGVFSSLGVLFGLLFTVLFCTSLVRLIPDSRHRPLGWQERAGTLFDRILAGCVRLSIRHSWALLAACLVLSGVFMFQSARLEFTHDGMAWLPLDELFRTDTELIDKKIKGGSSLEFIIDTGEDDGVYSPAIIRKADSLSKYLETSYSGVLRPGKTFHAGHVIRDIHHAVNEGVQSADDLPGTRAELAQEILLLETLSPDLFYSLFDNGLRRMRFSISIPWADAVIYESFIAEMKKIFSSTFGDSAGIIATGNTVILGNILTGSIYSMAESYTLAGLVIWCFMMFVTRSWMLGTVMIFLNILPVLFTLALMKAFSLPLDLFTMLIGSIGIGLVVDDSIHIVKAFQRIYAQCGDPELAVRRALLTTGRAVFITSAVLTAGFFVFCLSSLNNIKAFGITMAAMMSAALLLDLTVTPAALFLIHKKTGRQAGRQRR